MSDDRIDPETLAAFFDGTASEEEREGVMRTLARSKEAYASFIEAAAVHRALQDEMPARASTDSIGLVGGPTASSTKPTRRWLIAPLLLAAGIAGVIVFSRFDGSATQGAIQLAQNTRLTRDEGSGSLARAFGETWDQPPWSVARGSEASLPSRPRAVRAGARYAELELAAQAADTAAVLRAAEALGQLLAPVEAGAPVAAEFQELSRAPDFGGPPRRSATAGRLRALLGAEAWFDLGVWTETARLAVAARDVAFFDRNGPAVAELRRIMSTDGGRVTGPADSTSWEPVARALEPLLAERSWTTGDLDAIDRAIRTTMAVAAR